MPAEILEEFVHDVISQETTPHTAELTDFKWAICTGAVCVEHAEYLASARLRFAKQTEDARVTLGQFDLLDPPSATKSQSFSDSSLAKVNILDAEYPASNDGSWQKDNLKKRSAPGDDEFAARKEVKKVALMQQVRLDDYSFIFLIINYHIYLFEVVDPRAFSRSNLFGSIDLELYNSRDTSEVETVISSFICSVRAPAKPTTSINTACAMFMWVQRRHCASATNPG
jgi:hypothetical protein